MPVSEAMIMIYKKYADLLKAKGKGRHRKEDVAEKELMSSSLDAVTNHIKSILPNKVVYFSRHGWQNSGNITDYAWIMLTTERYKADFGQTKNHYVNMGFLPLCISVFLEKKEESYILRVCLELFHDQCSHADFVDYCRFLVEKAERLKDFKIFMETASNHLLSSASAISKNALQKLLDQALSSSESLFFSIGLDFPLSDDDDTVDKSIRDTIAELLPIYEEAMNMSEKEPFTSSVAASSTSSEASNVSPKPLPKNIIFYGPPGTGKTYSTNAYCVAICDEKPLEEVSEMKREDINARYQTLYEQGRIKFVTFHQSYTYEDFVIGIFPKMSGTGLSYELRDGAFKSLCDLAREDSRNFVIVIDEINRGNISKIFGELITLIEESRRLGGKEETKVDLPLSDVRFSVPSNVYIIGTMNTADRSIQHVDTALRRRFKFIEVGPNPALLSGINVSKSGQSVAIDALLSTINRRIARYYDREHVIGHSYFLPLKDVSSEEERLEMLGDIFHDQIIPLLQDYFFEDYGKIQKVLNESEIDDQSKCLVQREPDDDFDDVDDIRPSYKIAGLGAGSPFYDIGTYLNIVQ